MRLDQQVIIDGIDDLQVPRQQALEQFHRPAFQRLGQQRVVGVGNHLLRGGPGLFPMQAMDIDQQAHQFRHGDGRMGVVDLHRHLVGEIGDTAIFLNVAAQDVLQRGRGEEIFLPQAQFLALRR